MSNNDQSKDKFVFNRHSDKISNPKPHQHRCNAHLEDILDGISQWPMDVSKPFGIFVDCLRSQPGQEPARYSKSDSSKSNNDGN